MKKIAFLILIITSFISCSNDDDTTAADNNPCGFEDLGITEAAKYPLTPESTTDVWNWKITNDTLKVQTRYYGASPDGVVYETYFFKIEEACIKPLFCKYFVFTDYLEPEIYKADVAITIESFELNTKLTFQVNGFSNITQDGVTISYPVPFFTSPNGNTDVWVMLDSHYENPTFGGYNWVAE